MNFKYVESHQDTRCPSGQKTLWIDSEGEEVESKRCAWKRLKAELQLEKNVLLISEDKADKIICKKLTNVFPACCWQHLKLVR